MGAIIFPGRLQELALQYQIVSPKTYTYRYHYSYCACVCAYMWRIVDNMSCYPWNSYLFLIPDLSLLWSSPIHLVCLASKPQGFSYLCLPITGLCQNVRWLIKQIPETDFVLTRLASNSDIHKDMPYHCPNSYGFNLDRSKVN